MLAERRTDRPFGPPYPQSPECFRPHTLSLAIAQRPLPTDPLTYTILVVENLAFDRERYCKNHPVDAILVSDTLRDANELDFLQLSQTEFNNNVLQL